jgi:hypothetical protein
MKFSNSTEWDLWSYRWCRTCQNDINEDCHIILNMLLDEPTPEIEGRGESAVCTEYKKLEDA